MFKRRNVTSMEIRLNDGTVVSQSFRRPTTFWQALSQLNAAAK